jgi:hypothetical protein
MACVCMPQGVGQRFLDDAVSGELEWGRKLLRLPCNLELDLQTGGSYLFQQVLQPRERRLGREVGRSFFADPDDAEHPPELVERLARRASDRAHRSPCIGRIAREHRVGRSCLHDDHAQVVRDDVVNFARNPGLLLCCRSSRIGLLLPLQLRGPILERT